MRYSQPFHPLRGVLGPHPSVQAQTKGGREGDENRLQIEFVGET